ncbi:MAG: family 10 glycosylhydrolase [Spirulinaceae cyanobacterium RM2_2_10]|nr:family 10 glycosylhydrolase [Spirulinaceae cyanobacterium RM2_2_10]
MYPGVFPRAIARLADLHFNTLYPVVWNRGLTLHPSAIAQQASGRPRMPLVALLHLGTDPLATLIRVGHQRGFRVLPWFEYGLMTPVNSALARQHPDWLTHGRDRQTESEYTDALERELGDRAPVWQLLQVQQAWLNPLHPEVQEFIKNLILEVVENYNLDGIQLDDHFGMPVEMGYDPYTVELYQREHNSFDPPDDPRDPQWMGWRANKLTELMADIYAAIKAVKPSCIVSLSPNSQSYSFEHYLQNWRAWVEQGIVDEIILQAYRFDRDRFLAELEQPAVTFARERVPVSIGILSGTLRRPMPMPMIQEQVTLARERGFPGVAFFYWESLWGYITPEAPAKRRQGFRALFPEPARSPQIRATPPN